MNCATSFWTDKTSVLFTALWRWEPEKWASMGWTKEHHREKKLEELSDPFICVCYVTKSSKRTKPNQRGKICGYFLVSHERGDRNKFIHSDYHHHEPKKWRFAVKASQAFSYLPMLDAFDVFPKLSEPGFARFKVAPIGVVITDPEKQEFYRTALGILRNSSCERVEEIYRPQ